MWKKVDPRKYIIDGTGCRCDALQEKDIFKYMLKNNFLGTDGIWKEIPKESVIVITEVINVIFFVCKPMEEIM